MTRANGKDDQIGRVPKPVFLERQSYRRRRLMDAARLLPIFGAVLFAVPLLWPAGTDQNAAQGTVQMSDAILYIFAIWSALIVIIALFGLGTRLWTGTDGPQRSGQE